MTVIKFKLVHENAKLPVKATPHACCYDVYACKLTPVGHLKVEVDLGFQTEIPVGWKGCIVPRSGVSKYNWMLANSLGKIDSDYRGTWKAIFNYVGKEEGFKEFPYKEGERVAQIYFDRVEDVQLIVFDELSETKRGKAALVVREFFKALALKL